jgi:hypothetical protein
VHHVGSIILISSYILLVTTERGNSKLACFQCVYLGKGFENLTAATPSGVCGSFSLLSRIIKYLSVISLVEMEAESGPDD